MKDRSEIETKYKWDLSRIYKNEEEFNKEFNTVLELVKKIESYKGHIMDSSDNLYNLLELDNKINTLIEKLYIYSALLYNEDMTNSKNDALRLKIEKLEEDIIVKTSFIIPEMLKTDYKKLLDKKELEKYQFMLEKIYRYKKYTLSDKEEKLLANVSSAMGSCSNAHSKLENADRNLGMIEDENGNLIEFTDQKFSEYVRSSNRDLRIRAINKMYDFYKSNKYTFTALYSGAIKESTFFSKVKKYNSSLESSLYKDNIDISVYKNLISETHNNLNLLHKFVSLKKNLLKLDEFHMYDIYAEPKFEIEDHVEYEEAKKILDEALQPLGNQYINDLHNAYTEKWIDVFPNKGKRTGAYQWGPYKKPFVSLNYNYKMNDVSTMAHELGHAMHTYYSDKYQSTIYHDYPIFLAEIASTVNEVLLTDYLIKKAVKKEEKIKYLLEFLETFKGTIYRQVMFAEFEMLAHDFDKLGTPLTEELLSDTYYNLNKKYFGEKIVIDEFIRYEWMRIPHFYTPFYVYKYATGLSSAIVIASDILNKKDNSKENYLEFLKSGGSDYPLNILKKTGVDLTKEEAIKKAFDMFESKLKELEKLIND